MGRTALYRDLAPFRPARAGVQLDADAVTLAMPDGRHRRHALDGCAATWGDGVVAIRAARPDAPGARPERRFVRMLVLERGHDRHVIITPPDRGAVAPGVVRLPEAPHDAAVVEDEAWDPLADWLLGGGRLAGCSIGELARLAAIATAPFALVIGEVAAQRALELVGAAAGPLRGLDDVDGVLQPLVVAARSSPRVAEALVAARALVAGAWPVRRRA